jgi:hypothetical protein
MFTEGWQKKIYIADETKAEEDNFILFLFLFLFLLYDMA